MPLSVASRGGEGGESKLLKSLLSHTHVSKWINSPAEFVRHSFSIVFKITSEAVKVNLSVKEYIRHKWPLPTQTI